MTTQKSAVPHSSLSLFFSHGFRTFFLATGFYAVLVMVPWVIWIATAFNGDALWILPTREPLPLWHAHELIYGFVAAAIAGFLLTAVPSWTGATPLSGTSLIVLFLVWILGRCVMWFSGFLPPPVVGFVDLLFVPLSAVIAFWQLAKRPTARNILFLSLLLALFAGNLLYHLATIISLDVFTSHQGLKFGLDTVIVMIVVLGGRIVPAFTHNAANKRVPPARLPKNYFTVDLAAIVLTSAWALSNLVAPDFVCALLALLAGAVNGFRLFEWRSSAALQEPLIWILHLGYGWLVVGMLLQAFAQFDVFGSEMTALHALSTGAAATLILAVMSRASLGNTGRPLRSPRLVVIAYFFLTVAIVLRIFAPTLFPNFYWEEMLLSGILWIAAFSLFSVVYMPILLSPRLNMSS